MPRVVHFDLSVDQPERAIKFYSKVFGWQIEKWDGPFDYWLIKTGKPDEPGIDGGFGRREDPSVATTNFIGVSSVDMYLNEIRANGGTVIQGKRAMLYGYLP